METNHPLARLVSSTDPRSFFAAIQGVEQWLADQGDSTVAKPLHRYLSRIALKLYGGAHEPCYLLRNLSSDEQTILQRFLRPSEHFFRTLLKLHDRTLLYEIKFDQLPAPTRKAINSMDWSQLPSLYNQRLEQDDNQRTMGHIVSTPTKRGRQPTVKIMFNMFEYYIFSFALSAMQKLVASSVFNAPNNPAEQSRPGLLSAIPFPKTVAPWQKDPNAAPPKTPLHPIYFELVAAYIEFFLPPTPAKDEDDEPLQPYPPRGTPLRNRFDARGFSSPMQRLPTTPVRQGINRALYTAENLWKHDSTPQRVAPAPHSGTVPTQATTVNIFTVDEVDVSQRRLASEFVVGTFVEIWLCQNDVADLSSPSKVGQSNVGYIKPTEAQIMCIGSLVTQTVTSDFYDTYRTTADRNRNYMAYEVHSARARAYQIVRPKLYWFLRTSLDHWPRDDSIASLVDLWLKYITPWKRQSPTAKYNHKWVPFVQDNFMFYTVLFAQFLQRAKIFDVYASVRPVSSVSGTKTFNKGYLAIVEQVFSAFEDEMLISVLKAIETAMFSLNNKHGYQAKFNARDLGSMLDATDAHAKVIQTLLNSGHDSRSKITQLGEKQDLKSVFLLERQQRGSKTTAETKAADDALALMTNIIDGKDRLESYLEGRATGRAPSSPTTPSLGRANSFMSLGVNAASSKDSSAPARAATSIRFPTFPSSDSTAAKVFAWLLQCWVIVLVAAVSISHKLGMRLIHFLTKQMSDDGPRQKVAVTSGNHEVVRANILRLEKCVDAITDVLGDKLRKPESRGTSGRGMMSRTSPSPPSRRASMATISGEEEVVFKTVAPGVLAPEERVRSDGRVVLTSRGREQLKKGLRMSGKENIQIIPSERASNIVMTYESKTLVKFWAWIADLLDEQYARLRTTHPQLPEIPSFKWLRHFAAWRNILFWSIVLVVLYFGLKVIWFLGTAILQGGGAPSTHTQRVRPTNAQRGSSGTKRLSKQPSGIPGSRRN
ncbi:hypothetical protein DFJ77DRAFT_107218 [Powellomyces hirtus]|nr:hypothetical protein DFJ77DRAFT_107218 [Powellomyces hirtus]